MGQANSYSSGSYSSYTRVRIIHNIAGGYNIDLYLDGKLQIGNIAYQDITDYLRLMPGRHRIVIKPAGSKRGQKAVISRNILVKRCKMYTLIIAGDVKDPRSHTILPILDEMEEKKVEETTSNGKDETETNATTETETNATTETETNATAETVTNEQTENATDDDTYIRFIHAAAGVPEVDVWYRAYDGDIPLFKKYEYKDASKYIKITPGEITLLVAPEGTQDAIIGPISLDLEKGKTYSVIASGPPKNADETLATSVALTAIVAVDRELYVCVH